MYYIILLYIILHYYVARMDNRLFNGTPCICYWSKNKPISMETKHLKSWWFQMNLYEAICVKMY